MASLHDQWQVDKQHRQEQIAQRRQQVHTALAAWQHQRHVDTAQLRHQLQTFHAVIQDETHLWLTQARQQRQTQARQTQQRLTNFVASLQTQTAEFLALTMQERLTMAHRLADDLKQFRADLQVTVSDIRLDIAQRLATLQTRVHAIQAETHETLVNYHHDHAAMAAELRDDLSAYVTDLRLEVGTFLQQVSALRQSEAVMLRQTLSRDRTELAQTVQAMFSDLVAFRDDLKTYHQTLKDYVWGGAVAPAETPAAQPKPPVVAPPAASRPTLKSPPKASKPVAAPPPATLKPPKPAAAPTSATVKPTKASASVKPPTPAPAAAQLPSKTEQLEEAIFNYLYEKSGARLTEIEASLGINRFQAVDALRSLIQKELIIQKDRIYQIQEEVAL